MQSTLNIIGIIILLAISFGLVAFAILDLIKTRKSADKFNIRTFLIYLTEILFVYVFPGIGISFTNNKCQEHPFQIESITTTYLIWILVALAYLSSRYFKKQLSPLLITFISVLMVIGILFCFTICIHFVSFFSAILVPGFNLLYLSPLFCFFYLLKESNELNKYLKSYIKRQTTGLSQVITVLYKYIYQNDLGFVTVLLAPVLLILQALLFLIGQQPDSIITQFTESCGYLLSKYQDCSCGGGHYLCSIAANGNKKLVRPTRFGVRANQRIVVNRQLLIANAFENWLEDYMPKTHRFIRKSYDACNIPVNKWSKHTKLANVLYIIMKPLEWIFLLWLYLFDKNPESRIAKQYFPKEELTTYLKLHNYENHDQD